MKKSAILPILGFFALSACSKLGAEGVTAALAFGTRPAEPPPAVTETQIPDHESWCYSTMGFAECYTKAQDVNPHRLVNVDPQNRYPLTPQAYRDELAGKRGIPVAAAATDRPVPLEPAALEAAPSTPVERNELNDVRVP
jgi:hypothetical protein